MPFCAVKWCGKCSATSSIKRDGISFHRFPKCSRIKEKWLDATKRGDNWFPSKSSVICSRHFTQDSFRHEFDKRLLCANAVPTLMLPTLGPSPHKSVVIATVSGPTSMTNVSVGPSPDKSVAIATVSEPTSMTKVSVLPNDMENSMKYHLLGSVVQIHMRQGCVPTKFQSHPDKGKQTSINTEKPYAGKKRKKAINEECDKKSNSTKFLEFEVPLSASAVPHGDLENIKENEHNTTVDKSIQSVGVPCLATSSAAETSSVTQRMLSNDSDNAASDSSDHIAGKATTSQEHNYKVNNPSPVTLFIKEEVCDPDYDQPMDQDNNTAAQSYIKKEPVEDTCEFENGFSHVPKSSAETEELKKQLEAKTSEVEMYKNEVNELQQKNIVLQDQCEKLTKLLKKCLTKSPCSEIGTEFTEILSHSPHKVEHNRTQMELKESKFKAKIKMLLESVEESQQLLQAKQEQWDIKENEFLEKIKQLKHNLQELQQGQVENQAVQFIEKDKILEEKEREWLEKERKWLEQLEMKETQWLEKERSWQEKVEERDRQISKLQGKCIEPLGTNR